MTFAQRQNCLTTHFSVRIPVVKRRMSVFCKINRYISCYPPTYRTTDKHDVTCDRQTTRITLLPADKHSELPTTQVTLTVSNHSASVLISLGAAKLGDSRKLHVNRCRNDWCLVRFEWILDTRSSQAHHRGISIWRSRMLCRHVVSRSLVTKKDIF
jgi:hypothetical protein